MKENKFRAWAKKTIDHYISDPIDRAYKEFENTEPRNRSSIEWDIWHQDREDRMKEIINGMNPNDEHRYEITYEMITDFSVKADGTYTRPYGYEILDVMQDTGFKDCDGKTVCEGDIMIHDDSNRGYGGEYDKLHDGHLRTQIPHIDDLLNGNFEYEAYEIRGWKNIGNIYENSELLIK